jgi:hypothetical protein
MSKLDHAAMSATLPKESKADARLTAGADYLLTLTRGVIDRLKAMRAPGESHSDVTSVLQLRSSTRKSHAVALLAIKRHSALQRPS